MEVRGGIGDPQGDCTAKMTAPKSEPSLICHYSRTAFPGWLVSGLVAIFENHRTTSNDGCGAGGCRVTILAEPHAFTSLCLDGFWFDEGGYNR